MKLVNAVTGVEIKSGDPITTFRGGKGVLNRFQLPSHAGTLGRVHVTVNGFNHSYFPNVIGAKFIAEDE